jgi:hypothetical protein
MTATGAAAGKAVAEECKSSLDRSRGITGDIPDQNSASGKCGASSPLWWQRGDGPIFVLRPSTLGNANILYHSILGLASPKQILGHLSEMPTIRPGDEIAFCGYFICPASPVPHLHIAVCIKSALLGPR